MVLVSVSGVNSMSIHKPDLPDVGIGDDAVQTGYAVATVDFDDARTGGSPVQTSDASVVQAYTVKPGDTLPQIAQRVYGSAIGWSSIYHANREQLDDPDMLLPGQVLNIPARPGPAEN